MISRFRLTARSVRIKKIPRDTKKKNVEADLHLMLHICVQCGEKSRLISRIGNDTYGKRLLEIAAQAGIGTNYLIKDDEIETPHSYIFSNQENGSRTLFNFPGEKKILNIHIRMKKSLLS